MWRQEDRVIKDFRSKKKMTWWISFHIIYLGPGAEEASNREVPLGTDKKIHLCSHYQPPLLSQRIRKE